VRPARLKSFLTQVGRNGVGRYYDPSTGQFLTVDPLVDQTGAPYAYAAGNPVSVDDPSGTATCLPLCGASSGLLINTGGAGFETSNTLINTGSSEFQTPDTLINTGSSGFQTPGALINTGSAGFETPTILINTGNGGVTRPTTLHNKPGAQNPSLQDIIDELYRPGAKVGSGSTADAIRHELQTGELLSPAGHALKGQERLRQLEKLLATDELNEVDRETAKDLAGDLRDALATEKKSD